MRNCTIIHPLHVELETALGELSAQWHHVNRVCHAIQHDSPVTHDLVSHS